MERHYKPVRVRLRAEQEQWARDLVRDVDGLSVSDVARLAFADLIDHARATPELRDQIIDRLVEQAHTEAREIPTRVQAGMPRRDWREEG